VPKPMSFVHTSLYIKDIYGLILDIPLSTTQIPSAHRVACEFIVRILSLAIFRQDLGQPLV
jgi:hypothetical protein